MESLQDPMMALVPPTGTTREWRLSKEPIVMRVQGFIHPATLIPEELEYNKGYEARISKLNEKFK